MDELTQPILPDDAQAKEQLDDDAAYCLLSPLKKDSEGDADVSEHAGVFPDAVPSLRDRDQWLAGVFPGEQCWFRARMAHTHCPWLEEFKESMAGELDSGSGRALFDCSELIDVALPEDVEIHRTQYLIDVFFQKRFFRAHKKQEAFGRASPAALAAAWNQFVGDLTAASTEWFDSLKNFKKCYMRSIDGMKMDIHQRSINEKVGCCVLRRQMCPMCYNDSPRATNDTREGKFADISEDLRIAVWRFDRRWREVTLKRKRQALRQEENKREAQTSYAQVDFERIQQELRELGSKVYNHEQAINTLEDKLELAEDKECDQQAEISELREELAQMRRLRRR